jgi:hypothetical protein
MFRIEGDYRYINVSTTTESQYVNGNTIPVVKYMLSGSYELTKSFERLSTLEREWEQFKLDRENEKRLIESNPAVREAYKNYQTMVALAKDYNEQKL